MSQRLAILDLRSSIFDPRSSILLGGIMEAILLVLVCLAPWAFGGVEPEFEFVLLAGVATLLGLWGLRTLVSWRCRWGNSPVALCLAALLLVGAWQLAPLPPRWLARLAPATARLYEQLYPVQAEILPDGKTPDEPLPAAGSTLSVYPGQTRQELVRLLAVVLLFVVVHQNAASVASLRRLSLLALINGSLLSWFALLQSFSSPTRHTLYWRIPTAGTAFGPFGCNNHFAGYVNLCVGLGIGLLLSADTRAGPSNPGERDPDAPPTWQLWRYPRALWCSLALAFMVVGVACSLSRGGFLALLASLSLFLGLGLLRWRQLPQWPAVLLGAGLALGLLSWFGPTRVLERLATVWQGTALRESRLSIWTHALALAETFPIWGTGYGTFSYVEPMQRTDHVHGDNICGHAENEYLEALVEGGVVRLALALLAIALVYQSGCRAVSRPGDPRRSLLALGALLAFTTLVIQSGSDYGLHIPAIALLATVVCAQLCALGGAEQTTLGPDGPGRRSLRRGTIAPVVSVLLLLVLGTVLCSEGWRACRVHWLRHGNSRLNPTPAPVSEEQRLDDLIAAARLAPESASLQVELALLYYDRYRGERIAALQTLLAALHQTASAIGLVPAAGCPGGSSWAFPLVGTAVSQTLRHPVHPEESMVRQHLAPALQHVLRARALCPVLPEPHLLLAHNQDRLRQADTRLAYLERVRLLLPRDAGLWYGCGEEYLPHNPERTWAYWRRALELSDDFLPVVLERARAVLRPQEMLDKVIPDRPRLLLDAAQQLDPQADAAERRPFLQRALAVLDRQPGPPDAESLYLRARLQVALGNSDAARQAYEAALRRSPHADERRYEYAQYLRSLDKLPEARRELQSILRAKPEHAAARQFLEDVSKELAERN